MEKCVILLEINCNDMDGLSIILIIASILLILVGLVGAVVPGIAGTPISFLGLLALSVVDGID